MRSTHLACLLIAAIGIGGCTRAASRVVLPVQNSAAEQYKFAESVQQQSNLPLITDPKRYAETRHQVRESYVAVIQNFPEDREFTPLARLVILEMDAGLDSKRAPYSDRRALRAIDDYEQLLAEYSDNEFVQAKGRYDMAQVYMRRREFSEAMGLFRWLRDQYATSADPHLAELGKRAAVHYNQIYVENE